jgi:site-specific DNA recombinase
MSRKIWKKDESNQNKRDAYTFLDLKVTATTESADIKGYVDSSVLTTG